MIDQFGITLELAGAAFHGALNRLDGTVDSYMPRQVTRRAKSFAAADSATNVWTFASVSLHMLRERILAVKPTSALNVRALKWSEGATLLYWSLSSRDCNAIEVGVLHVCYESLSSA